MYRFAINADKVRSAALVADPLTLLDCSTSADGAAAIIIASESIAKEIGRPLIRIAGSAVATDTLALHSRPDPAPLFPAHSKTQRPQMNRPVLHKATSSAPERGLLDR